MRRVPASLVILGMLLLAGCSKKPATPEAVSATPTSSVNSEKSTRDKLLATLKNQRTEEAAWDVAVLSDSDKDVVPALVEMLNDKTNAGLGRRLAEKYSSVREAAVAALVMAEGPGIEALKSQGYAILRTGLNDPTPAVREHTILAIASLNDLGKPLAGDVFKLCTDNQEKVRGVAFDSLQKLGVVNALGMVQLLSHKEADVRRLSAEAVLNLEAVPVEALDPLRQVFEDPDPAIRNAAARALGTLGALAAPVVPQAIAMIRKANDKTVENPDNEELPYWALLVRIGEPAVPALLELLKAPIPSLQGYSALSLGQIGPPAKAAEAGLKAALNGTNAQVVFTAAVALSRIGVGEAEAIAAISRGLQNGDDLVVSNAIDTIPLMGKAGEALVPMALAKASSDKPFTRQSALELAVLLGPAGAAAAESLGKVALEETDNPARLRYVEAISTMGPKAKSALESLLKITKNKEERIELRREALKASVAVANDSPEVLATLKAAVADPNVEYQASAAVVMGQMNPMPAEIATTLTTLLPRSKPQPVRRAAVRSLALATPPAEVAKTTFEELAKASKDDFAYWAKFGLASLNGKPAALDAIVREGLKDRLPGVKAAAIDCLPRLGPAKSSDIAMLTKMLRDPVATVRIAAGRELARHGSAAKDAVPTLARMLNDASPEAQSVAIATLAGMGPDAVAAVPRLRKIVKVADDSTAYAARIAIEKIQPGEGPAVRKK